MNILITGASGFMGQSLNKLLTSQGNTVVALDSKKADLTKDNSLDQFNHHAYDLIFHLAAWTQAGDFCLYHQGEQWIINQQINTNTLAWWQKYQPQAKMIAFGTSVSYAVEDQLNEDVYMDGIPNEKFYAYAMSKRMLYSGLISLHRQFGLNYLYLIPSTLYGPNYHTDGRQMHFIFDLIRKIIRGKEFGEKVELWGDGFQRREIVFIDDFIDILLKLSSRVNNEIFNIGAGKDYNIREFASKICEIIDYPEASIEYDTSKYTGAKSKCLNVDKLNALLPDIQRSSLKSGLEKTIEWFYRDKIYLLS